MTNISFTRLFRTTFLMSLIFLFAALLFTADASYARDRRLTVAGASDLTFAMKEISARFEKETGAKVVLSMGSTGMLAKQIREGAPFDVFFSADRAYIETLKNDGLILPESVEPYAEGRIVLAVNKASGVKAGSLKDLLSPEIKRVAIANPDHAPYGKAAMEALKRLGAWDAIRTKIVYGENIRQTLQYIQTGDASTGIVALSVADVPEIIYLPIDPALHEPIIQVVGVVKTTKDAELSKEFIRYVNGRKGKEIMKRYGFLTPKER